MKEEILPGHRIYLANKDKYFEVVRVDPLPPVIHDFGRLAAGEDTGPEPIKISELEMAEDELGLFHFRLLDDFRVDIYQPKTKMLFTYKNQRGIIGQDLDQLVPGHSENFVIAVYKNEVPYVRAINHTRSELPMTRMVFWGFRLKLKEIPKEKVTPPYRTIFTEA
jgi:hypothetical protein